MQLFCLHRSHISRNFSTVYQFEGAFRRLMRKCPLPFFIGLIVITSPAWAVPFYTVTNLGTLEGYSSSQAYGINDSGQVTGSSSYFSQHIMHSRAFLYNPDTMAMTNLGTLGGDNSEGLDINNRGQVTGRSTINNDTPRWAGHAFLYDPSTTSMADLGTLLDDSPYEPEAPGLLAYAYSLGNGINNSGQVTGQSSQLNYDGAFIDSRAFSYDSGTMTDLGFSIVNPISPTGIDPLTQGPTYRSSSGNSINDNGQITGTLVDESFGNRPDGRVHTRAFLYDPDTTSVTNLGTLAGGKDSVSEDPTIPAGYFDFETYGNGINNSGQVTGSSTASGGEMHAFLYNSDTMVMTDLGTLGGDSTGNSINDSGLVAGSSGTSGGEKHAFLYDNGIIFDLNELVLNLPGAGFSYLSVGNDINNSRQIVGMGITPDGRSLAFLATPINAVPVPSSIALLSLGLIMLGAVCRYRP